MRILALDTGDVWTGTALSDPLGIIATPFQTVPTKELHSFLEATIQEKGVSTIVIGHPITMKGLHSAQTEKVEKTHKELQEQFPGCEFILWDERLTSQQADKLHKARTQKEKQASHSIAAALILQSYLQHLEFKRATDQ